MAENNISEYNISLYNTTADNDTIAENQRFYEIVGDFGMTLVAWFLLALTLTAVVYGVTSWYMIKRFRHFRNYVILSAIAARMLILLFFLNEETIPILQVHILMVALIMYWTHAYHCWLLVLCFIFYVDFVKVFHLNIRRRFLKSSLFAWGAPAVANVLLIIPTLFIYVYYSGEIITHRMMTVIFISLNLIPVAINLGLYITVLHSLFHDSKPGSSLQLNKWRRFYIATLIFLFSNVVVLTGLLDLLGVRILVIDAIGDVIGEFLNTIALSIYLIVLKSNRELWREYLQNRSKLKSLEVK